MRRSTERANAGELLLESLAWALPLEKVVLLAGLALGHGRAVTATQLRALLPETTAALIILVLSRWTARSPLLRRILVLAALTLAVASWLAIGSWAFAGAPVGLPFVGRLLSDVAIWRTALGDPALRAALLGWLGGFLTVWGLAVLVALSARRATRRIRTSALALAACLVVTISLMDDRSAAPEHRLALSVAFGAEDADAGVAMDPAAYLELTRPPRRRPSAAAPSVKPTRNVVILVLESVRREKESSFDVGFAEAIHFDRAYAHHPRSVKTLEALLFGVYPSPGLLSAAWAIDHYDVEKIGTLPRLLGKSGFETHYFSAMSLGFDNYGGALEAAGFDEVEVVAGDEMLTWGVAAPEILDRVADTLAHGRTRGVRQLVVAWTAECHAPYDHAGEEVPITDRRDRYLACQTALAANIKDFLARLGRDGLLAETLVVVLGDHGQIFDSEKAGDFGHGTHVYEQSLRIPVLFFVPGMSGRRDARLFQPVDVPFTIASHLGLAVPDAWVGRDMLDEGHSGRSFVVALSVLSDGQAAIVDASGAKLVRSPGDASWAVFDLARDPTEDRGRTPDAPLKAEAEARVATYERVAGQAWERSRRRHLAVPQAADGAEIAALWAPGPCVLTRLAPDGNLRVEPTHGHRCGEASDPFERRLVRAVDAAALAGGFELRVTLDVDAGAPSVDRELRTLVKLWGSENVFSAPLTREEGFQTVRLSLPAPPAANDGGDTVLAVVPADPSVAYTLHALEIAPAGRKP